MNDPTTWGDLDIHVLRKRRLVTEALEENERDLGRPLTFPEKAWVTRQVLVREGYVQPTWRERLFGRDDVRVFIVGDRLKAIAA